MKAKGGTARRAILPARRAATGSATTRAVSLEDDEATEPPTGSRSANERLITGASRLPRLTMASCRTRDIDARRTRGERSHGRERPGAGLERIGASNGIRNLDDLVVAGETMNQRTAIAAIRRISIIALPETSFDYNHCRGRRQCDNLSSDNAAVRAACRLLLRVTSKIGWLGPTDGCRVRRTAR